MDKNVNKIVKNYKKSLEELGVQVKKIILYGSYAHGKAQEWSDLDLIVLSDDFKGMDLWDRLVLLGRASAKIMEPIEAIGYTEEEFASEGEGTFIGDEVKLKGIEIL